MTKVTKDYAFVDAGGGGSGPAPNLRALFGPHRQLIVYHFMFAPDWDEGCSGCSLLADGVGRVEHLGSRDTAFAAVSRAPADKIAAFRARMGWSFPWFSSEGSDFNHDFGATQDPARGPLEYNFRAKSEEEMKVAEERGAYETPGISVFFRDGDDVYHTYSSYARGGEAVISTYSYLDLTPLGRQEEGNGIGGFKHHDKY